MQPQYVTIFNDRYRNMYLLTPINRKSTRFELILKYFDGFVCWCWVDTSGQCLDCPLPPPTRHGSSAFQQAHQPVINISQTEHFLCEQARCWPVVASDGHWPDCHCWSHCSNHSQQNQETVKCLCHQATKKRVLSNYLYYLSKLGWII